MKETENDIPEIVRDEDLAVRTQKGDVRALEQLYQRYLPRVYNRIRMLVPQEDVEDTTSEVFLSVVQSLNNFSARSSFSTWLYTVVKRRVADYYRRRARKAGERELLENVIENGDCEASVEDDIIVKDILRRLTERYQTVLFFRFTDELSFKEIAVKLNISLDAAKSLYRRAIESARREMETTDLQRNKRL